MSTDSRTDADLAVALVTAAGNAAWRHQQKMLAGAEELAVQVKSNPTDVVTAADTEAEARIVELLLTERPQDSVIAEEGSVHHGTSGRTWVIDPVDGTYNFVRGADRWCSAVALYDGDDVVLGAIGQARTARVWLGGLGLGVRENRTQQPVFAPEAEQRTLGEASLLTYLHPPYHATEVGRAWQRVVGRVATIRMTGSGSLDAVDVACGRADLVMQHSVPIWDSAPGRALVEALGGRCETVSAGGVDWYLAGPSLVVAEAAEALRG